MTTCRASFEDRARWSARRGSGPEVGRRGWRQGRGGGACLPNRSSPDGLLPPRVRGARGTRRHGPWPASPPAGTRPAASRALPPPGIADVVVLRLLQLLCRVGCRVARVCSGTLDCLPSMLWGELPCASDTCV